MYKVSIAHNHPATNGHFDGNPILPGVITLEHVRLAFIKAFPQKVMCGFQKAKLTKSVRPGEEIHVTFEPCGDDINFLCTNQDGDTVALGKIVMAI